MTRGNLIAIAVGSLLGAGLGVALVLLQADAGTDLEASPTTTITPAASTSTARPTTSIDEGTTAPETSTIPETTTEGTATEGTATEGTATNPDSSGSGGGSVGGAGSAPTSTGNPTTGSSLFGYVGCSNTSNAVEGYRAAVGGGVLWPPYPGGGGDVNRWAASGDDIWKGFDAAVAEYGPPESIWFQICENEENPVTIETVRAAIANIMARVPGATLYLSPLNSYAPDTLCERLGPDGISDLVAMADQAVGEGLASRGPQLGPLTVATTRGDRCHPDHNGMALLGEQLANFIGS